MKIQLDTTMKTIKIENDVNLFELWNNLNKLLPNEEWKNFTLLTNTQITYWRDPIYVQPIYKHYYEQPWYYCSGTVGQMTAMGNTNKTAEYKVSNKANADYSLKSGVFNIEL